jgi:hypothetical protein
VEQADTGRPAAAAQSCFRAGLERRDRADPLTGRPRGASEERSEAARRDSDE